MSAWIIVAGVVLLLALVLVIVALANTWKTVALARFQSGRNDGKDSSALAYSNFLRVLREINRVTALVYNQDEAQSIDLSDVQVAGDRSVLQGIYKGITYRAECFSHGMMTLSIPEVNHEKATVCLDEEAAVTDTVSRSIEKLVRAKKDAKDKEDHAPD